MADRLCFAVVMCHFLMEVWSSLGVFIGGCGGKTSQLFRLQLAPACEYEGLFNEKTTVVVYSAFLTRVW